MSDIDEYQEYAIFIFFGREQVSLGVVLVSWSSPSSVDSAFFTNCQ